jgi:Protein of unknown function (DUF1592)/Protein of unknown function (DUF1588)/Protein of unknown function (DUF1595)/Protein of unknown function (DUF1587)/Protein of unknown function (DUF1585)
MRATCGELAQRRCSVAAALQMVAVLGCSVDMETRPVGVTGSGISVGSIGDGGDDGDGTGDDGDDPTQDAAPAVRIELRRLTRTQYTRTIQQLVGDDVVVPGALPPDAIDHFFTTVGTATLSLGSVDVEQYETAARDLADAVIDDPARRDTVVGCDAAAASCTADFVARFGRLAFRRTLTTAESDRYLALAQGVAARYSDPWQGIHGVIATMLASPNFLYLAEIGEPDADDPERRRYTSVEMASRLSYFMWGHGPDVALLDRAEAGELDDQDALKEIATEMLAHPSAKDGIGRFFDEWLGLEAMANQAKDPEVFPTADAALFAAMSAEVEAMIDNVVFDEGDSVLALLDTRTAFVDDKLAAIYGLPAPGSDTVQPVTRDDDDPRLGLLGTAGVLALTSRRARTAPTLRGIYVQQRWRCVDLPPPPPDVDVELPDNPAAEGTPATMRELLEEHAINPQCASCHDKVDPLGLALEHFDALGSWRAEDNGLVIDDSGMLEGTEFHGLGELVAMLRDDPLVEACVVRQLYRYATGHLEREDVDGPAVAAMGERFADLDGRLIAFVPELVASEAFRTFAEVE